MDPEKDRKKIEKISAYTHSSFLLFIAPYTFSVLNLPYVILKDHYN